MRPGPKLAGCVVRNGLVGEDGCWCGAARLAATLGAEGEGELEQGRRNCKNHFRKEMRTEEKQAPYLGSQVIKH